MRHYEECLAEFGDEVMKHVGAMFYLHDSLYSGHCLIINAGHYSRESKDPDVECH